MIYSVLYGLLVLVQLNIALLILIYFFYALFNTLDEVDKIVILLLITFNLIITVLQNMIH